MKGRSLFKVAAVEQPFEEFGLSVEALAGEFEQRRARAQIGFDERARQGQRPRDSVLDRFGAGTGRARE